MVLQVIFFPNVTTNFTENSNEENQREKKGNGVLQGTSHDCCVDTYDLREIGAFLNLSLSPPVYAKGRNIFVHMHYRKRIERKSHFESYKGNTHFEKIVDYLKLNL